MRKTDDYLYSANRGNGTTINVSAGSGLSICANGCPSTVSMEQIMFIGSDLAAPVEDDMFFSDCRKRTKNTKKCDYCDERYKCWTTEWK